MYILYSSAALQYLWRPWCRHTRRSQPHRRAQQSRGGLVVTEKQRSYYSVPQYVLACCTVLQYCIQCHPNTHTSIHTTTHAYTCKHTHICAHTPAVELHSRGQGGTGKPALVKDVKHARWSSKRPIVGLVFEFMEYQYSDPDRTPTRGALLASPSPAASGQADSSKRLCVIVRDALEVNGEYVSYAMSGVWPAVCLGKGDRCEPVLGSWLLAAALFVASRYARTCIYMIFSPSLSLPSLSLYLSLSLSHVSSRVCMI